MYTEEEIKLAMLAMCIDCEGSINIIKGQQKNKSTQGYKILYNISVRVGNTDLRLMEWLKSNFNFTVNISSAGIEGRTKICYYAILTCRKASDILERIRPYLKIKESKAALAIEIQALTGPPGAHALKENLELKEELYRKSLITSKNYIILNEGLVARDYSNPESTKSTNRIDLAQLAMCIDCEGCISIARDTYSVQLIIGNTDLNLIKWLKESFGFTIRLGTNNLKNSNWSVNYSATLGASKATKLLELVRPYLILKGNKADLAIRIQETMSLPGLKLSKETLSLRESLYKESLQESSNCIVLTKESNLYSKLESRLVKI